MPRLYLLRDGPEIARRRALAAGAGVLEVWPDLYTAGEFWVGETTKRALDAAAAAPLPARLSLDAAALPIYYGPRLGDVDSLPAEESLAARVLSARGVAVAWITLDQFGERARHEPQSPADPIFYLRRPAGAVAHVWRLFRTKREARVYMAEHFGRDDGARAWADALGAETFDALVERHAAGE